MEGSDIPTKSEENLYFFNDLTGSFPKKLSQKKGMILQSILHEKTMAEKRMVFSKKELVYKYSFILKGTDNKIFLGEIDTHIFKSFSSYIIYITEELEELRGASSSECIKYLKELVAQRKRMEKA